MTGHGLRVEDQDISSSLWLLTAGQSMNGLSEIQPCSRSRKFGCEPISLMYFVRVIWNSLVNSSSDRVHTVDYVLRSSLLERRQVIDSRLQ